MNPKATLRLEVVGTCHFPYPTRSAMVSTLLPICTRIAIALLALATCLPLLPVGAWTVRLFDFPRVQLAMLVALPVGGLVIWSRTESWRTEHSLLTAICTVILMWQLSHIVKYTRLWPTELASLKRAERLTAVASATVRPTMAAGARSEGSVSNSRSGNSKLITSSVVNLQFENQEKSAVHDQLARLGSDLLLLIEIDEPWAEALTDLKEDYLYRDGVVRGNGLGIMLWSKLPVMESEVRYLVSDKRASVFAKIQVNDGRVVNFVGLHPTPPGLNLPDEPGRHDSRIRDAELMLVAKEIAERPDEHWIVTGDFNDVAWSHTTRVFKRISGLKDPRVGRGLYNTYHAKYAALRFPIDQIFLSPSAEIARLSRFHPTGSDHFAITTEFALEGFPFNEPELRGDDLNEADEMIREGKDDAERQGEASPETSAAEMSSTHTIQHMP